MIYAHSVKDQGKAEWETLRDHSTRVARAAAERAEVFGCADLAQLLGLLHDIGKIKPRFQARLEDCSIRVGHAGEGARWLSEQACFSAFFAGIIAGHHGALPNRDRLENQVKRAERIDLPDWCCPPTPMPPDWLGKGRTTAAFRFQFLVRMLYSCLTDADHVETGAFYDEVEGRARSTRRTELDDAHLRAFEAHIAGLPIEGEIGQLRRKVLLHARAQATESPGLFSLTVPTGGGKTLTSLGFGLDHARAHGLRRLIYVIPYISIVEQTADVFRKALDPDSVLEHHSAFDISNKTPGPTEDEDELHRMASESWNVPVVVTTLVQFFESLFAARKKRCRKLHSLARSVIVLDEAQMMPLGFLRPCLAALTELMEHYGATVVLSTATQPALTIEQGFPLPEEALMGARDLASDRDSLFRQLKRTHVRYIGPQTDAELTERMRAADRALLIVDNRVQARGLFDRVHEAAGAYHLSTLMTAAHRRTVLEEIRARLKARKPVRLISTSLIEAGVDISFPLVLRAAAGVDSIAQAAGRCNRNGELAGEGDVLVFESEHEPPDVIKQFAMLGREVLESVDDPIGPEAVALYFRRLNELYGEGGLDVAEVGREKYGGIRGILKAIDGYGLGKCKYEDIADAFQLIPDGQKTVIIRGGDHGIPEAKLEALRFRRAGSVARAFQRFSVSVPYSLWRGLWDVKAVSWWEEDRFDTQFAMLDHRQLYDDQAGLVVNGFEEAGGVI